MINIAYAAGESTSKLDGIMGLTPFILVFAVFYFLLIRPQQKKAKEHQAMIADLKKGARILTTGGIYGTIQSIDETTIGLEIAEKVKIKISRGNVAALLTDANTAAKQDTKK